VVWQIVWGLPVDCFSKRKRMASGRCALGRSVLRSCQCQSTFGALSPSRIAQLVAEADKRGKAERGGAVLAVSYRKPHFVH
jgi:hypothetical protein